MTTTDYDTTTPVIDGGAATLRGELELVRGERDALADSVEQLRGEVEQADNLRTRIGRPAKRSALHDRQPRPATAAGSPSIVPVLHDGPYALARARVT